MNGKWIEIFRGGEQTDSRGRKQDGDKVIDKALSSFNAEQHEPPVVIGHPRNNDPAFAWVEGLKKQGNSLFAKIKDAQPEFVEMVKNGLFKKRSAAFYPDGALRHVGFLGAVPPAVKGLANIEFNNDEDALVFEFAEERIYDNDQKFSTIGRVVSALRDFIIDKFDIETADKVAVGYDIEAIRSTEEREEFSAPVDKPKNEDATMNFNQQQMDEAVKSAADEAKKKAETEFSGERKENADKLEKLQREFDETKAREHKESIADFIGAGIKDGTILPAWKDGGLPEFMQSLDAETEIEFSDSAGKTTKASQFDKFKELMATLPKSLDFSEVSADDGLELSQDLDVLAREFSEKQKVGYKEALIAVSKKRPDLVGR